MALTQKIVQKVLQKTSPDAAKAKDILKVLGDMEQGKQGKRSIDSIINHVKQ